MSQRHTYSAISYVPECESTTAEQVADILERWRKRSEDHYSNRRKDHRFPYPNRVLVVATVPADETTGSEPLHVVVETQTRNLSCGGMSLLAAPLFVPQTAGEHTPVLHADRIFVVNRVVSIGLPRQGSEYLWMRGGIVRSRTVHHGFREVGISFVARQGNQDESAADDVLLT
jgi:hypothetical protein